MDRFHSVWMLFLCTSPLFAAELRIDSEVHNNVQGVKSSVYLLSGNFYSMIGENGEITFFDVQRQVFTLLDPALRIQTQIDAAETKKKAETLRQEILEKPHPNEKFMNFAVKPVFTTEYEASSGTLALQSHWIDYELKTIPLPDAESAKLYFDFCNWTCYLNLRINPRSTTMLVRLEVNRILQAQQRFATSVTVSLFSDGKSMLASPATMRSSHQLVNRLGDVDRKRLDQADECRRTFQTVPFEEYQRKVVEKAAK
ncbi:hypothetical protein FACS1894189_8080 [Planctomycetales bacterium]|nr:hypothetical protein FACS1894189_8080 [Planctomycetales bacterium]